MHAGRLAIVAAMREELAALLDAMPDERPLVRAGREFWLGHFDGADVVVVLSRIGKVAAATTATVLATELGVARAIFVGTAGGLGDGVRVGDVVVADALLQHDLDASPLFPRHEVPLYGVDRFPADRALADALAAAAGDALAGFGRERLAPFGIAHSPRVHRGLVVSGDRFVSSARESAELRGRLPEALCVEMEGAAMAQVCHDVGLPFAVVRTVSDRADDAAHVDFGRFVAGVASAYAIDIVRAFVRRERPSS